MEDIKSLVLVELKRHINLSPAQEDLLEKALNLAVEAGQSAINEIMTTVRSRTDEDLLEKTLNLAVEVGQSAINEIMTAVRSRTDVDSKQ